MRFFLENAAQPGQWGGHVSHFWSLAVEEQFYLMWPWVIFFAPRRWLPGIFTATDGIMALYERLVAPFPYEKLAHLQSSTRFGGMENASAIFYDGKLFPAEKVTDGLLAHEMAHQWFGDAVTEREWAHLWLSEGFADYFGALWAREARGEPPVRTPTDVQSQGGLHV